MVHWRLQSPGGGRGVNEREQGNLSMLFLWPSRVFRLHVNTHKSRRGTWGEEVLWERKIVRKVNGVQFLVTSEENFDERTRNLQLELWNDFLKTQ